MAADDGDQLEDNRLVAGTPANHEAIAEAEELRASSEALGRRIAADDPTLRVIDDALTDYYGEHPKMLTADGPRDALLGAAAVHVRDALAAAGILEMRTRVEELESGIDRHRAAHGGSPAACSDDRRLWRLIDTNGGE